ncbi:hypothetical protein [Kitasatospora sp. NPDC057500]|uniref:hypothetical protein n=1 Tax=Kitasatospora sp. NPDC057500 TaxID=3346151 RepID=UPI0036A64387
MAAPVDDAAGDAVAGNVPVGLPIALPGGLPDGSDGVVVSGELVARYPEGVGPQGQDDPTANGGLPVGSPIPGLPGAVVVARPSRPWPYPDADGLEAYTDGFGGGGFGDGGWFGDSGFGDGPGDGAGARGGAEAPPAAPVAPAHQRAEEAEARYGPEGELRTPRVLPQRVRNASLAEQLREAHASSAAPYGPSGPASPPADDPSPQRSRATMAAIQHGTRTARATPTDPDVPSAAKEQQ